MDLVTILLVVIICLLALLAGFLFMMGNPSPTEPGFIKKIRMLPGAVGEYLALFAYGLFRPRLLRTGATREEKRMALPGDELVPKPTRQETRATTIDVPAEDVWPWLVQMGGGRAGWYWWVPLSVYPEFAEYDNNIDEILPQFQKLEVGDRLSDGGPTVTEERGNWEVKSLEAQRHIVLYAARQVMEGDDFDHGEHAPKGLWFICSWVFVLRPAGFNRTRLLVRVRAIGGPKLLFGLMMSIFGYGDRVAHNTMFDLIKDRAEELFLSKNL